MKLFFLLYQALTQVEAILSSVVVAVLLSSCSMHSKNCLLIVLASAASAQIFYNPTYIQYSTVTGYFAQDDPSTTASTFDYVLLPCRHCSRLSHDLLLLLSSATLIPPRPPSDLYLDNHKLRPLEPNIRFRCSSSRKLQYQNSMATFRASSRYYEHTCKHNYTV